MNSANRSVASNGGQAPPGFLRELNAMLLVSGTCIGGGMLALPVSSAPVGYWPSLCTMLLTYVVMTLSGLLYFELTLWFRPGAHLITMSSRLLGKPGKIVCWITYLFIGFASLVGYTAAGGKLLEALFAWDSPSVTESFGAAALFSFPLLVCVALGKRVAGSINTALFFAMLGFYVVLITVGSSSIDGALLSVASWKGRGILGLMPVMLTMFSIPGIVPSLTPYLHRNSRSMKRVIIGGLALTFVFYLLWQTIVMGTVPLEGPDGLAAAYTSGELASCAFRCHLSSKLLTLLSDGFAAFALATSFIGISLALVDFLADGFGWKHTKHQWITVGLIFVPTVFLSIYIERAFVLMMELTGGIGDAIISILLPVSMVVAGRYFLNRTGPYRVAGGRLVLFAMGVVGLLVLMQEIIGLAFN